MPQLDTPNGEYVIGDLLGRGGMGQVHVARHASGRRVVVKRLRDTLSFDQRMAARFGDEGRVSRRVCHPNVVRVFDHGVSADGTPFIVMEHARGKTLRRLILEEGRLPLARIRGLGSQLLAGLAAIHDAGIVHADIKSSNLIVDTVGVVDHLTIIDFGLARTRTSRGAFDDGLAVGTPEYMAPEVCRGEPPTAKADLYSAAIVVYELIAGVTPFAGDVPLEVLHRQLDEPVALPPGARAAISPALEAVLLRALEKDPARRFPDARSFARAFDEAIAPIVNEEPAAAAARATTLPARDLELELESEEVRRRRREVHDALDAGSPDLVIAAYLGLADALIDDHRMLAAVHELEGALLVLLPRQGEPPASVWRIETLLAAMHDRLGNRVRARRAAMDAYAHAVRSGCKTGEQRTGALMRRLMPSRPTPDPDDVGRPGARELARMLELRKA